MEKPSILKEILKFYRNLGKNLGQILEDFRNIHS